MGKIEILLIIAFLIVILRNTIYLLFLWQLKEYRLDRFLVHLKTWQGQQLLLGKITRIKWLLLLTAPFIFFLSARLLFLMVFSVFSFEALLSVRRFFTHRRRIPIFTLKTILIFALVLFLILKGFIVLPLPTSVEVLFLERILVFLVTLVIILTNIPAKIYHRFIIAKAKQKIINHPQLLTIGITGSYGKSTTKEFLAQILSWKFKVLKTPANINTDIGVARTILKSLKKEHQFFVCEMGAYKRGEIKAICDLVRPKIGIITGINEQHLALFGNLRNTVAAKFELIKAVPEKGLAVFNGENKYCLRLADKARAIGREVKVVKKQAIDITLNLPVEFFLVNFLMAKEVAERLGAGEKAIFKRAKELKVLPHTMQMTKKNGLTLVDDTYNSNPYGVLAALEHLKTLKGKKFFVFQPIIELGKASGRLHHQIGKKAGKICNQIILTNKNYYQDFMRGAKHKVSLKKELPKIQKGAILFEGREARSYLNQLTINN